MNPLCQSCGGRFPRCDDGDGAAAPCIYSRLSLSLNPEVLAVSCREVGLPSLALVEVFSEEGDLNYFEMGGSIQNLFNQDTFYDQ